MAEHPPTIPYQTPTEKRVDPIVWWITAGFALFLLGVFALFMVEPERPIDPPASPLAQTIVATVLIGSFVILLGSSIWWMVREYRRRRVG